MAPLPFSAPRLPHFLLGFLLLLVTPIATTAQLPFQICRASDANYTANSTFQSNLNRVLSSLAANGSASGFLNDTAGDIPDRVYGLVLCRGDVAAGDCRSCLATAAQDILQACPYKRSAVIWYDNCMLRYSNLRFFSTDDDNLKISMRNTQNLTEVAQFNRQRDNMMAGLVRYAAYNGSARMFATGEADYGDTANPKIYGLVQCTRDLTADACNTCLKGILGDIPTRFPPRPKGARILKATCNFRYEQYGFYNSSVMVSIPLQTNATPPMATPAAPEKKRNKTGTVLAIAIPSGLALVVISVMCVCFYWRKSKVIKFCK